MGCVAPGLTQAEVPGAWFELLDEPEPIQASALAFVADLLKSPTQLLADLHRQDPAAPKGDSFY